MLSLRDHAYAKAPYLLAGGGKDLTGEEKATEAQLAHVDVLALAEAERPLIGDAEAERASSTPTCSGPAPPAAPASSSARSTSSTSTTSSTCAATRC